MKSYAARERECCGKEEKTRQKRTFTEKDETKAHVHTKRRIRCAWTWNEDDENILTRQKFFHQDSKIDVNVVDELFAVVFNVRWRFRRFCMMASCAQGQNESSSSFDILNLFLVASKWKKFLLPCSSPRKKPTFDEGVAFAVSDMLSLNLFKTFTTEYYIDELENKRVDIRSIPGDLHHIGTWAMFNSTGSRPHLNRHIIPSTVK